MQRNYKNKITSDGALPHLLADERFLPTYTMFTVNVNINELMKKNLCKLVEKEFDTRPTLHCHFTGIRGT